MAEEADYEEGGGGKYTVSDFLKDMPPTPKLAWQPPRDGLHLWVFWNEDDDQYQCPQLVSSSRTTSSIPETTTDWDIRNKIKSGLRDVTHFTFCRVEQILVQFWAPMRIGGRCILTTSNQPFGVSEIERGLCKYRKHCVSYEIIVKEDELGVIGRVFRGRYMESTPDVEYYSNEEYPQRHIAVKCGVRRFLALPVFDPSGRCCVGVLELVDNGQEHYFLPHLCWVASRLLQGVDLKSCYPFSFQEEEGIKVQHTMDEIKRMLEMVCGIYNLPLAQIWIPCRHSSVVACGGSSEENCNNNDCYLREFSAVHPTYRIMISTFVKACQYHNLRKGHGIVGRAISSQKSCFCNDITKFPINEYPLAHYARTSGLTRCFAIFLNIENCDYVLELFLPPYTTDSVDAQSFFVFLPPYTTEYSVDAQRFFESLVQIMKLNFPTFKIASGEEMGEELSVEVIKFSVNEGPDSFKIRPPPTPEALDREDESSDQQLMVETVTENEWNISGAEQNELVVPCLKKIADINWERDICEKVGEDLSGEEVEIDTNVEICQTTRLPPMPESLQNEAETVQKLTTESVTCIEEIVMTSDREQRTTEVSFSCEVIKQHFGMKLADAAKNLGVSRSTLKRICRNRNIKRWPFPKKHKVNHEHVNEFVQVGNELIPESSGRELSDSDSPSEHATGAAQTTVSVITPLQDVVTIKAKYGDVLIKFQLCSSSGMTELVENVTKRLPLDNKKFSIKYQDEDGEWVLIACDGDLHDCLGNSRLLQERTAIRMLVDKPLTDQAP